MKNKKVLISGGTHGIGLEIAKILAKNKFDISFFSRSKKNITKTLKTLKKYNVKTYAEQVDALNLDEIENFFKNLKKNFGEIDILINNV